MTIKKCARHCKGFKYMGVQVSNIVQCNDIAVTSVSFTFEYINLSQRRFNNETKDCIAVGAV